MTDNVEFGMAGENRKLTQAEIAAKFQEIIDDIMRSGSEMLIKYARKHKLGLVDSRLSDLDKALDMGIVTIK